MYSGCDILSHQFSVLFTIGIIFILRNTSHWNDQDTESFDSLRCYCTCFTSSFVNQLKRSNWLYLSLWSSFQTVRGYIPTIFRNNHQEDCLSIYVKQKNKDSIWWKRPKWKGSNEILSVLLANFSSKYLFLICLNIEDFDRLNVHNLLNKRGFIYQSINSLSKLEMKVRSIRRWSMK